MITKITTVRQPLLMKKKEKLRTSSESNLKSSNSYQEKIRRAHHSFSGSWRDTSERSKTSII